MCFPELFEKRANRIPMATTVNLNKIKTVMQEVYGPFPGTMAGCVEWKPRRFAGKTRYLWTDAFGLCNFLTLWQVTNEEMYLHLADALIEDVHDVLGRDR
eukprot:TRINITY_DN1934_c0_g1_i15.p1 TRINITY_DN1934_c0_g1~~TRINITY_DN1934_c0_g1_i15.p1  ORF type:complete len:100 (-),score=3.90 TRINITY_DN1934_c0_g1_i15:763-1062(-)